MKTGLRLGLFGPPGAGKGTQAERLAVAMGFAHISTGDMFRSMQTSDSELARHIREIIDGGRLVPDELVTQMTLDRLSQPDAACGFILDGFPRTLVQAIALQDSPKALDALIEIRVPREEIISRLSGRRVCESCRAIYHVRDLARDSDACQACGGKLTQRDDDRPEAIAIRLNVFESNFAPLVKFYRDRGLLLSIDGYGDPQVVFERLLQGLRQIKS